MAASAGHSRAESLVEPGTQECLLGVSLSSAAEVDALIERASAAGAEVVSTPTQHEWGYTGTFADPDGHMWSVLAESAGLTGPPWLGDPPDAGRSRRARRLWCDGAVSDLQTVEDVVARMLAIDDALDARDGVAVFNHVYLRVTRLVQARLSGGTFHDDAFMAELDVRFAMLWLAAHDAPSSDIPHAWEPLFERRTSGGLLPIQFALAGMNAHIEHDLPLAVVATCAARGRKPTSRRRSRRLREGERPARGDRGRDPAVLPHRGRPGCR